MSTQSKHGTYGLFKLLLYTVNNLSLVIEQLWRELLIHPSLHIKMINCISTCISQLFSVWFVNQYRDFNYGETVLIK